MNFIAIFELMIFLLNIMLSFVIIFRERKSTSSTWSWLFVVNVLPILGFILYLLIGRGISHYRIFKDRKRFQIGFEKQHSHARKAYSDRAFLDMMRKNPVIGQLINMLYVEEKSIISTNTDVKIFNDGREKFDALIEDINRAKYHIHMEYYIFRMDDVGQEIYEALIEARKRGVEVKLLIDAWGSNKTKMSKFKELEELGGRVAQFFPLILPLINPRTNYRLHRKIVVIDGVIGYTGGFNVGNEYASVTKKFGYWRDNHLRLTGDIVYSLQHRFILDWNSQHHFEITQGEPYFPDAISQGHVATQLVTSGPDEDKEQIKLTYMKMISGAEREIVIQTPYYIPSDALHESLKLALLSGVQVKMMIPNKPDHPLVYWATYFHAADLVKYGAKVYTYENGFVHSKTLIIDGEYASVGSANLDYRSLQLCFEANVVIYNYDIAQKLRNDFIKDLKLSRALTLERYEQRSKIVRFKEGLARLIAPML
ncbi:cardiolipin synthase [Lactococcus taiwanensis]|uniref:Cardiolipin synthase n=1 Tax=Lactococcus taiwanensis TaxID=1151742 RepID=A0AA45QQF9_9LACT|nr:cardiolipin synthase [Lactococcus taiwanensis]QSE75854.1 cardiolipin synthase [Lactococcus taiwanensis]